MSGQFIHIRLLVQRILLMLVLLMAIRFIFSFANHHIFTLQWKDLPGLLIGGFRYDLVTLIYLNGLFILLSLLPLPARDNRVYQKALHVLYLLFNIPLIIIELTDVAYYSFNNKRMTSDVAGVAVAGIRNTFQFAVDYWYLFLLLTFLIYILYKWYPFLKKKTDTYNIFLQVFLFVAGAALCVIGARGGLQNIPITPANAAEHADIKLTPLVLNSTYSVLYSIQRKGLVEKKYMNDATVQQILQLQHSFTPGPEKRNIVLIILESYASEYIGFLNKNKGYTPFTDSLFSKSLVFPTSYANAERSNKSICVLLGGLPPLTDDAFMNTVYSANCFEGIGTLLKKAGYYTSFFHGGINGEFKFDSFTKAAGFDHYHGKNEFNNDQLFDGNWGIYDDAFFNYTADEINQQPQPFCTALFSLSAHHPFNIPASLKNRFQKGPEPIHEAIGYTDYALQQFFVKASAMSWFKNTLFIITADHTFGYGEHPPEYNNAAGRYRVPLAVYDPLQQVTAGIDSSSTQHLDIKPTILDLAGISNAKSYGRSIFQPGNSKSVQLRDQLFQVEDNQYILFFDGKESAGLYDYRNDVKLEHDISLQFPGKKTELENYIKALVQDYYHSLIYNRLCD